MLYISKTYVLDLSTMLKTETAQIAQFTELEKCLK